MCVTIVLITKTLTFAAAFSAFLNEVLWLIVASFFFSKGFVKTGLGERLAMFFVRWLGKSTLGLSYGLVLSEAAVSPAMPSTTARAGGIFLPIIKSLAEASDSKPKDPSARKLGAFLVQAQLQGRVRVGLLRQMALARLLALVSACIYMQSGIYVGLEPLKSQHRSIHILFTQENMDLFLYIVIIIIVNFVSLLLSWDISEV